MKIEDAEYVLQRIKQEGMTYCFINYSNFEEIKDDEFHKLRLDLIKSTTLLKEYLNDKSINGEENL